MKSILKTALLSTTILMSLPALSQDGSKRLALKFHGEHLRGENVIALKREVRSQFPRIQLQNFKLDKVIVLAKSKQGRGKAILQVGDQITSSEIIDGRPYDFHDPSRETFSRLRLHNPAGLSTRGPIRLHLKGNIKLQKVVLKLQPKRVRQRLEVLNEGQKKLDKIVESRVVFNTYQPDVKEVILSAAKAPIDVTKAVVVFGDGTRQQAPELMGLIKQGSQKVLKLRSRRGRHVEKVIVKGTSPKVFGSRGEVVLKLGVLR